MSQIHNSKKIITFLFSEIRLKAVHINNSQLKLFLLCNMTSLLFRECCKTFYWHFCKKAQKCKCTVCWCCLQVQLIKGICLIRSLWESLRVMQIHRPQIKPLSLSSWIAAALIHVVLLVSYITLIKNKSWRGTSDMSN